MPENLCPSPTSNAIIHRLNLVATKLLSEDDKIIHHQTHILAIFLNLAVRSAAIPRIVRQNFSIAGIQDKHDVVTSRTVNKVCRLNICKVKHQLSRVMAPNHMVPTV